MGGLLYAAQGETSAIVKKIGGKGDKLLNYLYLLSLRVVGVWYFGVGPPQNTTPPHTPVETAEQLPLLYE